jgi:hypothetical protein
VVSESSQPSFAHRLSDLSRAHPADRTLENLLRTLTAKLDLCARLPVYEYEAHAEGHDASAHAFHELAVLENRTFKDLLVSLEQHLQAPGSGQLGAAQ